MEEAWLSLREVSGPGIQLDLPQEMKRLYLEGNQYCTPRPDTG